MRNAQFAREDWQQERCGRLDAQARVRDLERTLATIRAAVHSDAALRLDAGTMKSIAVTDYAGPGELLVVGPDGLNGGGGGARSRGGLGESAPQPPPQPPSVLIQLSQRNPTVNTPTRPT
jgi:hypothetical protein